TKRKPILIAEDISADPMPRHVNLTLYGGEILGLAGMVGSGRTELARTLFGVEPLRTGKIVLNGKELLGHDPNRAMRAGLALVPEDRKTQGLFMGLPIRNNITLTILDRLTRLGIIERRREAKTVQEARSD